MKNSRSKILKLWSLLMTLMTVLAMTAMVTYAAPKISKKKVTLLTGQKVTLKVTGTKKKVSWSSNKKSVATVTKKGKVTAKKKGKATITAKVGSKKLKCVVTVEAPKLSKSKATVKIGKRLVLKLNGTIQTVTWKTSDKTVATVTKRGVVRGIGAGTTTITATVLKKRFTCTITVPEAENEKPADNTTETPDSGKSDSGSSDSGSPSADNTGFVFARDCKVTTGTQTIYIEFKINKDTTTEEEMEALGYTVKDGYASDNVVCETATYVFTKLPETLEDIKSIPLTTKFAPVAAAICACAAFDETKTGITNQYTHPIFDMMDYLNGPSITINNVAKSGIFDSMRNTLSLKDKAKMAYFNGAAPENSYTPTQPYTFKLVHGPYYIPAKASTIAHPQGEPERHMILISFAGDDAQRYVDVYHSGDGNWYTWDNSWQHLVADMKDPAAPAW